MPSPRASSGNNLEQLKRQAKDLLKAVRASDSSAAQRVAAHLGKAPDPERFQLAHAQLVIAREHGFPSWPRLKEDLELRDLSVAQMAERFLLAVTDPVWHARAKRLFERAPELATFDIATAAALGRADRVRQTLVRDPGAARRKLGPRAAEPLVYACFSRLSATDQAIAAGIVAAAEALLASGGDPNATFDDRGEAVSALYGAVAANNPKLVKVLLDAGANPADHEALYHATEHRDHACLTELLARRPSLARSNALFRMLDFDDARGVALLLGGGADVHERLDQSLHKAVTPLHHAIRRSRNPQILALLVDHGAALDALDGDGCTPYALAKRLGRDDAAELLASRGASRRLSAVDSFLNACSRGDADGARTVARANPGLVEQMNEAAQAALPEAAIRGDAAAVKAMVSLGMNVDAPGDMGMTALHSAAWWGNPAMVDLLLGLGADLAHTNKYGGNALSNAVHGSIHCPTLVGDYGAVVERLLAAGAKADEWMIDSGNDAVGEAVRKHLSTATTGDA